MIRTDLTRRLQEAVERLRAAGKLPAAAAECPVELSEPPNPERGDYATNFAMVAAGHLDKPPRETATLLAERLREDDAIESVEVAGPGFVNIRLKNAYLARWAVKAQQAGESIAKLEKDRPEKVLVEFVSVNPNGPIHLGHGRGAAYGDTLARILESAGDEVGREFYVNDGVNSQQMQLFALSVQAKYRELLGLEFEFPEEGYGGDYVGALAAQIRELHGDSHAGDGPEFFQSASQKLMIEGQRADLERFGVRFDTWFSEQALHDSGEVNAAIETLKQNRYAYEEDGALWLKSTAFGDDKDRCIVRSNGRMTYIASDIAYHKNKFDRGFDRLINVWGADHHGYIARTRAAIEALGYPGDRFDVAITQIVRFLRDGKVAPMAKRTGEMIPLAELMDEVGVDVTRFFYLMRSHDSHMDFDIDLAKEHSEKNPVFYVQYAHARICSLLKKAEEAGLASDPEHAERLVHPSERALIKKIWDLPFEVRRSADDREVHRLTTYAVELARQYHDFYEKCRVISPEEPERSSARLLLCEATLTTLRAAFNLLRISAPELM